ncbi:hypothetical protein [Cytobacillus sp.]|uniref:hypothetical protein n=1 Tax=Cytobacillus sp. TaxID=2675269 RepID=UPI003511075B
MPEINLPTKATQDLIKTQLDLIKPETDKIEALLEKPSGGNTLDPYPNIIRGGAAVTNGTDPFNTWVEVARFTGEGAILECNGRSSSQASGLVQIEIDGVIVFEAPVRYSSGYYKSGLQVDKLQYSPSTYSTSVKGYGESALPYINPNSADYGLSIEGIDLPFYFKSSLVVRLKITSATSTGSFSAGWYLRMK